MRCWAQALVTWVKAKLRHSRLPSEPQLSSNFDRSSSVDRLGNVNFLGPPFCCCRCKIDVRKHWKGDRQQLRTVPILSGEVDDRTVRNRVDDPIRCFATLWLFAAEANRVLPHSCSFRIVNSPGRHWLPTDSIRAWGKAFPAPTNDLVRPTVGKRPPISSWKLKTLCDDSNSRAASSAIVIRTWLFLNETGPIMTRNNRIIIITIDAQRDPSSQQAADDGQMTWNQPSLPSRMPSTHWWTAQRGSFPMAPTTTPIPLVINDSNMKFSPIASVCIWNVAADLIKTSSTSASSGNGTGCNSWAKPGRQSSNSQLNYNWKIQTKEPIR